MAENFKCGPVQYLSVSISDLDKRSEKRGWRIILLVRMIGQNQRIKQSLTEITFALCNHTYITLYQRQPITWHWHKFLFTLCNHTYIFWLF